MLSDAQIAVILEFGYEQRAIEFKAAGARSDRAFLALVARAAIALSNQRDGGHIIVGLSEEGIESTSSGLPPAWLEEWLSYDDVVDQINAYADPPLSLHVKARSLPNGKAVVVIEVSEFADIPTLSKKDYPQRVVARSLYTRSMAKPESIAAQSQNELREVLGLATEKQLSRFITTARRVGMQLAQHPLDEELFEAQSETIEIDPSTWPVDSRSYFRCALRPSVFEQRRVDYPALSRSIAEKSVRWRGWPFPQINDPERGDDWIREEGGFRTREAWQFFQSGLFVHYAEIERGRPDYGPDDASGYLPAWLPLLHFTEAFEFAARLQRSLWPESDTSMRVEMHGIMDRRLVAGDPGRGHLVGDYRFPVDSWARDVSFTPEQGLASTRDFAVELSLDLLERFGWPRGTPELLRELQDRSFGEQLSNYEARG